MSTKPSTYAQWDSNGTNLSAPTSGHKTDGFATDEIPTSSELNGWMRQVSDWTQWLYDGDIDFADITVTGSTTYTGGHTLEYSVTADEVSLDPLGTGDIDGLETIFIAPTLGPWIIHGIVGGSRGRKVVVSCQSNYVKFRSNSSTANAGESINIPTMDNDADIVLENNGSLILVYHGDAGSGEWQIVASSGCRAIDHETCLIIPGGLLIDNNGSHNKNLSGAGICIGYTLAASTNPLTVPIVGLMPGDRIKSYTVLLDKDSGGTGVFASKLYSYDGTTQTETAQSAGYSTNESAPGAWSVGESSLNILVDSDKQYVIQVDPSASCTGDSVFHALVNITRPRV